ncbi:MAG TPA: DCC1-like thiol-disulfide oxidoreductase family protein, partial [Blastocatellia bacterium]
MKEIETGAYMLFDGDCGVCSHLAETATAMDRAHKFTIEPYQNFPEAELARFGITYLKCSKRIYVVSPRGHVFGGAFGVNYFLWDKFPWSILVFFIYLLPILLLLEIIGYRLFAINRGRISGL